ncbi:sugar transferase [Streptomyces armeniacus]|uniref:Sugar transferase n=1 Tax=Streptomyces armeniacus TaxID=83291 RepID=A0A345XSJ7_9ACTN|nr:exopolysaccharide biosynthesis polyprenyl glycosylphosphotransferase [Streptomyces armeniacus]AXK34613.1 sugar transferase [Streptomyces armeniacus]
MTMESTGAVGAGRHGPAPDAGPAPGPASTGPGPAAGPATGPGSGSAPAPVVPGPRPAPARSARAPRRRAGTAALVAVDCAAAAVAVTVTCGVQQRALLELAPALPAMLVLHTRCGLYRPALLASALDELPRLLGRGVLTWSVATTVVAAVRTDPSVAWSGLFMLVVLQVTAACAGRGAVHLTQRRKGRRRPRAALVVGAGQAGRRVTSVLYEHPEYGLRPVGLIDAAHTPVQGHGQAQGHAPAQGHGQARANGQDGDRPEHEPAAVPFPLPVLRSPEDIARAVVQNDVRDAVFTRAYWGDPQTAALAELCSELGCTVWLLNGDSASGGAGWRAPDGAPYGHLWGFGCLRLDPAPRRPAARAAKRALDIVAAVLGLVAVAPLLLACALAVRIADGPGVIFRQERTGGGARAFVLLKFRTLLPSDEHESSTRWNVAGDGRMSAVGRFLRRTSLDELPQLWNVLRGDMSLVGPRPERPFFVQKFSQAHAGYAARHRVPTGITGLAQVNGLRGDTSIEDRARFDNHYIETWSLWQDIRILLRTVSTLFRSEGG